MLYEKELLKKHSNQYIFDGIHSKIQTNIAWLINILEYQFY